MKLEVTVDVGSVLNRLQRWLAEYEDVVVTVEELAANPKVVDWLKCDVECLYSGEFENGLENCDDLGQIFGYESNEESEEA